MIEEKYIELMNREIDGLNSSEESAELKRHLEENAEAERYFRELSFVAGVFDRVSHVEPPPELKEMILSSVFGKETRAAAEVPVEARPAVPGAGSLFSAFRIRWEPRFAYVFTAGILVGIFLFVLFWRVLPSRAPQDLDSLYGALTSGQKAGESLEAGPVHFDLPQAKGSLQAQYQKARIVALLDVFAVSKIKVTLTYDEEVTFEGITALKASEYQVKVGDARLELTHRGDCSYVIVLEDRPGSRGPISLSISDESGVLFEGVLQAGRE